MSLICPKCSSEMKSYERNRVLVDQCTGCGGLFLDKGELEQLAAAENAWHAAQAAPPVQDTRDDRPRYDSRDDRPRYESHDSHRDSGYSRPRKKKSFLSEMFDD
jgi:Zn-finger nucleic acid-binding protein